MCLAIPGRLLEVTGEDPLWREGRVDFSGIVKKVNLACVPSALPGDHVLVHAGLAISIVDEAEAQALLDQLRRMGEAELPPPDPDTPSPNPATGGATAPALDPNAPGTASSPPGGGTA